LRVWALVFVRAVLCAYLGVPNVLPASPWSLRLFASGLVSVVSLSHFPGVPSPALKARVRSLCYSVCVSFVYLLSKK